MKKALPGLVPSRFLKVNINAFEKGYEHGVQSRDEQAPSPPGAAAP
jgi:2-oxoglutarate ferredoxin oxidoreductase subunit gamma